MDLVWSIIHLKALFNIIIWFIRLELKTCTIIQFGFRSYLYLELRFELRFVHTEYLVFGYVFFYV